MSTTARPLVGIALVILSTWALSSLDAGGKWLMQYGLPLVVLSWVRYLIHAVLVLMFTLPSRGLSIFKSKRLGFQIIRGTAVLTATMTFFSALRYLPQAEATAINFLAPLLVLCLAPFVLKEPPRLYRWVAALCGFIGVMVIVRPGSGLHPLGVMFGLMTAGIFSLQFIVTRQLAEDDSMTTLLWTGLIGTAISSVLVLFYVDELVSIIGAYHYLDWLVLLSTGIFGTLGHWLQIKAYQHAPASLLAPFVYLQIVGAATIAWLIWRQFPDAMSWLGILIVCASGVSAFLIEWRHNQATKRLVQQALAEQ
ncbi:Predicted permease, DMT superfamily [Oligella urethralis]|uniref:DMT family transporter n=1 Tax=Oligella urethralis TaxID=90245 RepID=UPI000DFD05F8|nr:DMT family transporter [Oligella urethralis]SUA53950.1 Predicted permease, DMT superfamily [Oligella urethralis]